MPTFLITSPDGAQYHVDAPEGATEEQALAQVQAQHKPFQRPPDALDNPNMATEGMSGFDKFTSGMGKAFTDLGRGAYQLAAPAIDAIAPRQQTLSGLVTGKAPESRYEQSMRETKENRATDAPLMKTGAGLTGNIAGNLVPAVATSFIPGANTYTGAAALGAALGALNPAENGRERVTNTLLSGGAGMLGKGAADLIGRVVRPVRATLSPETARLAQVAEREGIPLDAAQVTGSKPLQTINAVMENLPFTAGPEAAKRSAQQAAFNKAALSRAGIAGDLATPDVLAGQKAALGKTFEDIAGRNSIDLNPIVGDLADITHAASRRLVPDQARTISNAVDDILSQAQNGTLTGTNYQGWRSELGKLSRSNDSQGNYFGQIKKALDNAFMSQVSGADAAAWKEASGQYGSLKTIMDAMGGPGAAVNSGNVTANQLVAALTRSVGKEGKALGRGNMNDLVRVGQAFIREQVPNSGTAQRVLYQNLLTGGIGGAVGGGAGYAKGGDFGTAAKGAAMGAGALYAPRLAQMLLESPAGQSYLTKGIVSPAARQLAAALQRSAIPASVAVANSK